MKKLNRQVTTSAVRRPSLMSTAAVQAQPPGNVPPFDRRPCRWSRATRI